MSKKRTVLGVLAGRDLAPGVLAAWLEWADRVVAADGGADLCRAAGREPDAIVGDLDSIADATGLTPDDDQDTSDADKLLVHLEKIEDAEIALIGVEGDRLDHVLATLYSVARSNLRCRIIIRSGVAHVLLAPFEGSWRAEGRVSLLPLGLCRATLRGVRWPLEDVTLDPLGLVSISNEAADATIRVEIHEGAAVLLLGDQGEEL